jgi:hypothetical protein
VSRLRPVYEVIEAQEPGSTTYYATKEEAIRDARYLSKEKGGQLARVARAERTVVAIFEEGKRVDGHA